jgi:MFS family permease
MADGGGAVGLLGGLLTTYVSWRWVLFVNVPIGILVAAAALVVSFVLGLLFVPLALVALHNVAEQDAGVAASLLNTGQQVGGPTATYALATGFSRGFLVAAGLGLLDVRAVTPFPETSTLS